MVNINQVPMSTVNSSIDHLGPTQAINLLNSNITSAAAVAAGIQSSVCRTSPTPRCSGRRPVNQALRPFPQYLTIDTSQSGGDKSGHSTYQRAGSEAEPPLGAWPELAVELRAFQTADRFRYLLRQQRLRRGQGNRRLEKSIGQYDQTHVLKFNTHLRAPVRQRTALDDTRHRSAR